MLCNGNDGRKIDATNTERASNLTQSQCVIELAVRLAEKESLTLFLSDGISPPSDNAKIKIIFEIDALLKQFILHQKYMIIIRMANP
ncbi:MAG: hypothetical protein K2N91_06915 [Muribaculaceae bacterium]|nr:hypothetical protein [Muribaculaceae bacterium]